MATARADAAVESALYPPIEPYRTEMLPVTELHSLYLAQFGNPEGKPVLYLHGGPGGGFTHEDARRFDPDAYRIVCVDQRGAGKSTPTAASSLEDNTTQALIADCETIRQHLQIERWTVFGGSWGSTLSLAYAQAHPSSVTELVLRGIFLLRRKELDFFYGSGNGTRFLFPDEYEAFEAQIPPAERGDMIAAYYKRLTSTDLAVRRSAAQAWSRWEMATSRLHTDPDMLAKADSDEFADVFARIEAHYFVHGGFIREGQLLERAEIDKIRHIPTTIVQGRYDCVCPAISAWDLHRAWPEATFIITHAGHSAKEVETERELVKATDAYARKRPAAGR